MKSSYDIVIVGGGMVGMTLACALAKQTALSIAVLEVKSSAPSWTSASYYPRVSAIALSSQRIFDSLQIWQAMQQRRVSPFTQMQVWDDEARIHFDSAEIAETVLGYIIENNVIETTLYEKIKQYPFIHLLSSARLTNMQVHENEVRLEVNNEWITTQLAIAADGAQSSLRMHAGIEVNEHDYDQAAVVATVRTELPHQQTARQVFLETGPLAFLPLSDPHYSSIVWSLPTVKAKESLDLDVGEFSQRLANAFSLTLGSQLQVEQRYLFSLRRQQAKNYIKPRIALVGDAAHTIHPLAGQGVNMGLLDAASLVDVLVAAIQQHRDFASLDTLRRYERWRKADNMAMFAGVDAIKTLFAADKKMMQAMRRKGLALTNEFRGIKNRLVDYACGNRAGLPTLAKV